MVLLERVLPWVSVCVLVFSCSPNASETIFLLDPDWRLTGGTRVDAGVAHSVVDRSTDAQQAASAGGNSSNSNGISGFLDSDHAPGARNVILLIADGYSPSQIDATRMFLNGDAELLAFEELPYQALLSTDNAQRKVTDSAASATAMATGRKVSSYVVSVALPGNGEDLLTALEIQKGRGKSTGLVTTHTQVADATPAAFGAHDVSRHSFVALADDYLHRAQPDVLLGGPSPGLTVDNAEAAGYFVPQNTQALLDTVVAEHERLAGWFAEPNPPTLGQMTTIALEILSRNPLGFFLLSEQEGTDTAGHAEDLPAVLEAALEFHQTVKQVLSWASQRDDTLVIVGADHETGGLELLESSSVPGKVPAHRFQKGGGHSNVPVRFFAQGPGASRLSNATHVADVFPLLAGLSTLRVGRASEDAAVLVGLHLVDTEVDTEEDAAASLLTLAPEQTVGGGPEHAILLKFDGLVERLPRKAHVVRAFLEVDVSGDGSSGLRLHRVLLPWSEETTWQSFGETGPQASAPGVTSTAEDTVPSMHTGIATFDVTDSLQRWIESLDENEGWLLLADGGSGLSVAGPNSATPPRLTIHVDSIQY